jgi:hypothetical protein
MKRMGACDHPLGAPSFPYPGFRNVSLRKRHMQIPSRGMVLDASGPGLGRLAHPRGMRVMANVDAIAACTATSDATAWQGRSESLPQDRHG